MANTETGPIMEFQAVGIGKEYLSLNPNFNALANSLIKTGKKLSHAGMAPFVDIPYNQLPLSQRQAYEEARDSSVLNFGDSNPNIRTGNTYGNLSVLTETRRNREFLITCTGSDMHFLSPGDIAYIYAVLPEQAQVYYYGERAPSSEARIHSAIYRLRQDVKAVVHVHCSEISANPSILGIPITSRFEKQGSIELVNQVVETLKKNPTARAIEMRDHGQIFLARTLDEAVQRALDSKEKLNKLILGIVA
ncbi:class II aldolase/adducin family protein [Candidatus Pacearchaeota archaeon]|nr:class II aldolase/adducin family protein [Candidatus Pacearchaeota archaeon]